MEANQETAYKLLASGGYKNDSQVARDLALFILTRAVAGLLLDMADMAMRNPDMSAADLIMALRVKVKLTE